MSNAQDYAQQHADRFQQQFIDLLKIPSISTLARHAADVEAAAQWIADDMQRIGMDEVEIIRDEDGGLLPMVYGAWLGAGDDAPTVLVYCHYDVQPAEMADGWHTDPFTPTEKDGKLYARGALDSKCHIIAHLKALESLLASGGAPVNVKLLFEGEEESSSPHLFKRLATASPDDRHFKADVCVISDGSHPDMQQPVLIYGLRGLVAMRLTVTGPARDLHSGHYGGNVHNPIQALAEIITALHDENGHVTVPGFYDAVREIDADERARLANVEPLVNADWHNVANAPQIWGEPGFGLSERMGARPTLEINGITGGFAGPGFKTVIPHRAHANISCRLVPDQDPAQIVALVRDYVQALTPPTVSSALVELEPGAPGFLLEPDTSIMQAAIEAYTQAWGKAPVLSREGGSVPVVAAFQSQLHLPVVLMPYGFKGGGAHGPDEYLPLPMLQQGIATTIYFYDALINQKI